MPLDPLFSHAVDVCPPLSDEQLAAIPAKRGVLLLAGEGDVPILLLTAADIRSRLRNRLAEPPPADQPKKTADLRQITRRLLYTLAPSHFAADLAYLELARTIHPRTFKDMLSWRRAWLVQVDPQAAYPHFSRTREPGGGLSIGPFPSGQSAQQFIEALEDLFDLCRDFSCLRQAPHGAPCSYLQMGRCTGPCNGTIPMEQYRQQVTQAAAFAAGDRQPHLAHLQQRMQQAAGALEFERAAALKKRLERAKVFEGEEYAHARPLEQWQFILVQPSGTKKQHEVFLVAGPDIIKAAPLDKTPTEPQLLATLQAMAQHVSGEAVMPAPAAAESSSPTLPLPEPPRPAAAWLARAASPALSEVDLYRLGLLAHYLFSSPAKRGAIIRYHANLSAPDLAAEIKRQQEEARQAAAKQATPEQPQ